MTQLNTPELNCVPFPRFLCMQRPRMLEGSDSAASKRPLAGLGCSDGGCYATGLYEVAGHNGRQFVSPSSKRGVFVTIKSCQRVIALLFASFWLSTATNAIAQSRFAKSDNMSGYVHWIDLYDSSNRKIDPAAEAPRPYSPAKTCGRCHDTATIAHGWHFNAVDSAADHGRPGQPWIWSDHRTGTHLPLSYRGWKGTHNPDALGLSRWEVAAKFGGFLPGGGVGTEEALLQPDSEPLVDRSRVTGPLLIDCMLCHRNQGSGYSPFVWTEQIEEENFTYAPTVALGLATVRGSTSRLKDDFDPEAEDAADRLPKIAYEQSRFRSDGKVFFDLVRKPTSDACYYCHTNVAASSIRGQRWMHDEDVHLSAGLACADCHRNSIDHHMVRGYEGEHHVAGEMVASLSCRGCHIGGEAGTEDALNGPGRFAAPKPTHRGLPALHFEKMTCTACHSGPLPGEEPVRQINSIAHRLGEHVRRTGEEQPGIVSSVQLPVTSSGLPTHDGEGASSGTGAKYTPHRMMWPSFWGTIEDGKVTVLNPEIVYDLIRRPLRVRKEFTEELGEVTLSLTKRKELLGENRAKLTEDDWTDEEKAKIAAAETEARQEQVGKHVAESLAALEEEFPNTQAVYVSGGMGFVRKGDADYEALPSEAIGELAEPYAWPVAHNVRPAAQSLGATGCLECHSENASFFQAEVRPVGLIPDQDTVPFKAHELQNADMLRLSTWNRMFVWRSTFKVIGLIALSLTALVTLSSLTSCIGGLRRRSDGS